MDDAVVANHVTKRFTPTKGPATLAVDDLDVEIPTGRLFGFLGPNGAGKTTLMDMIRGHMDATAGDLRVLGHPLPAEARRLKARIGVAPQIDNLDPDFTARKNLIVYARYFEIGKRTAASRADELLAFVGLSEKADARVDHLSGGMKRRLVLARALINEPELLVLDEPTTGLDPQARHLVWEKVGQLRRRGITILLTTHYMEEAQRLCDSVAVMDQGRILERGTPAELVARHATADVLEIAAEGDERLSERVRALAGPDDTVEASGDRVLVYTTDADALSARIRAETTTRHVLWRPSNLEDVFIKLTGRELRE